MGRPRGSQNAGKSRAQPTITTSALPLLKKPHEHLGKQVEVPGSFWEGRMTAEERITKYKCTIVNFDAIHRWDADDVDKPPSQAFELKEMGTTGTGSLELGDSSGEVFWMPYPQPFLTYYYDTFPSEFPKPKGDADAVTNQQEARGRANDSPVIDLVDCDSKAAADSLHPDFPSFRVTGALVFKYFSLNSDALIEKGPHSGLFRAEMQCIIVLEDGTICGKKRQVTHKRGKAISTTNLIGHLKECSSYCAAHKAALMAQREASANFIVTNGELVKRYGFSEAFTHQLDLVYLRARGITGSMLRCPEFQEYVRGYDVRATFPNRDTLCRMAETLAILQSENRKQRIKMLKQQLKGEPCLGLQLDMWSDSNTHTTFACISMSTVADPCKAENKKDDDLQLLLQNEILEFNTFPKTEKTGENIKAWFLDVLSKYDISHAMVSGITPDGAADGQCGLSLIETLAEKVDTCLLHQLQRAVLYSVGLAGSKSKNTEAKELLRKNNRIVMLTHQSLATNKAIKVAQINAGVPDHQVRTLITTATTRWGNQFEQLERNNLLRAAIDPTVEKFKKEHKNLKEAIVETNESDEGSKAGRPVAASELGLTPEDWECNQEMESFLSYPYDIKQSIEHTGFCTGAQGLMLLFDLKHNFCNSRAMLEVKGLPPSLKLAERERPLEQKRPAQLSSMIDLARAILSDEIETRCFLQRSSNARMVQLYMSKQMDAKDILSPEQYVLARACYLQWIRIAHGLIPRAAENVNTTKAKAMKSNSGAKLFRGSLLCPEDDGGDTSTQNLVGDAHDEAISEVDSWARLPSEAYADFFDDKTGLLNEFAMMWRFRHKFPIHFIVFKQTACHLPHEAFVEQVFSTAGFLSETQLDPEYLANLVMISRNKDAFKPTCDQVKEKYYQLFRGKGGEGMDVECEVS